jgi:transposase
MGAPAPNTSKHYLHRRELNKHTGKVFVAYKTPYGGLFNMTRAYTMPRKIKQVENWENLAKFVGIDYHKRSSVITVGDSAGNCLFQIRLPNDEAAIRAFFEKLPTGTSCAIESCRGYEWFIDLLTDIGHKVHVANAHAVKLIAQTRCKTDKVDSKVLMELLAKGFLPTCYQPTAEERALRERLRWRAQLVRTCTKFKNMVHALLDKENKGIESPFTDKGRKQLCDVELQAHRADLVGEHLNVIDFFDSMLDSESAWIRSLTMELPEAALLKTFLA